MPSYCRQCGSDAPRTFSPIYIDSSITASRIERLLEGNPGLLNEVKPRVKKQFLGWYEDNMEIIQTFEFHALFLKHNGKRDIYGASAIWNHMRWNTLLTSKFDAYKLPAFACSCTARVVMALNEELEGMFRTCITNPKCIPGLEYTEGE